MNLTDIQFLFQYNCWANSRTLDATSILRPEQFSQDLGTSHRGQVIGMLRQHGAQAVVTDLLVYVDQNVRG
jgi:uncharacterized damage-inducible protein DinB